MQRVKLQARYQEENCLFVDLFIFKLQSLAAADLLKSSTYIFAYYDGKKIFGPVVNGY